MLIISTDNLNIFGFSVDVGGCILASVTNCTDILHASSYLGLGPQPWILNPRFCCDFGHNHRRTNASLDVQIRCTHHWFFNHHKYLTEQYRIAAPLSQGTQLSNIYVWVKVCRGHSNDCSKGALSSPYLCIDSFFRPSLLADCMEALRKKFHLLCFVQNNVKNNVSVNSIFVNKLFHYTM